MQHSFCCFVFALQECLLLADFCTTWVSKSVGTNLSPTLLKGRWLTRSCLYVYTGYIHLAVCTHILNTASLDWNCTTSCLPVRSMCIAPSNLSLPCLWPADHIKARFMATSTDNNAFNVQCSVLLWGSPWLVYSYVFTTYQLYCLTHSLVTFLWWSNLNSYITYLTG